MVKTASQSRANNQIALELYAKSERRVATPYEKASSRAGNSADHVNEFGGVRFAGKLYETQCRWIAWGSGRVSMHEANGLVHDWT